MNIEQFLIQNNDQPVILFFEDGYILGGYPIDVVDAPQGSIFKFVPVDTAAIIAKQTEDVILQDKVLYREIYVDDIEYCMSYDQWKYLLRLPSMFDSIRDINIIRYPKS